MGDDNNDMQTDPNLGNQSDNSNLPPSIPQAQHQSFACILPGGNSVRPNAFANN